MELAIHNVRRIVAMQGSLGADSGWVTRIVIWDADGRKVDVSAFHGKDAPLPSVEVGENYCDAYYEMDGKLTHWSSSDPAPAEAAAEVTA